jgi:subtilase family serine protease
MSKSGFLFAFLALAGTIPAQNLTYTANPPRVFLAPLSASPMGIPACASSDPTLPIPGVIYCYSPAYIWTAYKMLPVLRAGDLGQGQTIVIVGAFGSPTIKADLQFHQTFLAGLPAADFQVICPM